MSLQTIAALVETEGVETTYVRAGSGAPVVVLRASATPAEEDPLVAQLAQRYRVFAPDLSCAGCAPSFPDWLRGVIEALGLEDPRVVITAGNDDELAALLQCLRD